jgi:ADP-ribose pyrophosphatase YjhB (NUDIX family)
VIARDNEGKILLIKRKIEPRKGEWALPSGFMELEESPIETALRELAEETGLKGKSKKLIGVYPNNSEIHGYLVAIIYEVKILGGKLCAGDDAEEAEFFAVNQLPFLAFQSPCLQFLSCLNPVPFQSCQVVCRLILREAQAGNYIFSPRVGA